MGRVGRVGEVGQVGGSGGCRSVGWVEAVSDAQTPQRGSREQFVVCALPGGARPLLRGPGASELGLGGLHRRRHAFVVRLGLLRFGRTAARFFALASVVSRLGSAVRGPSALRPPAFVAGLCRSGCGVRLPSGRLPAARSSRPRLHAARALRSPPAAAAASAVPAVQAAGRERQRFERSRERVGARLRSCGRREPFGLAHRVGDRAAMRLAGGADVGGTCLRARRSAPCAAARRSSVKPIVDAAGAPVHLVHRPRHDGRLGQRAHALRFLAAQRLRERVARRVNSFSGC